MCTNVRERNFVDHAVCALHAMLTAYLEYGHSVDKLVVCGRVATVIQRQCLVTTTTRNTTTTAASTTTPATTTTTTTTGTSTILQPYYNYHHYHHYCQLSRQVSCYYYY